MRHELKYVVDLQQGEDFMLAAREFCRFDQHAGPDGYYETLSIYYDTDSLRFFWDRQESVGFRRKVRLRRYAGGADKDSPLFLEVKEKHKHMIAKKRATLLASDAERRISQDQALLSLDSLLSMTRPSSGRDAVEYLHARLNLMPVVNVRYLRQALAGAVDPTIRITLDKRLSASMPALCDYDPNTESFFLPPSKAILEIKCERSAPLWVVSLIRRFGFARSRYSKYCEAIEVLKLGGRNRFQLPTDNEVVNAMTTRSFTPFRAA